MHNPTSDYRRKSIRLPEYDYSTAGMYFVTICTHGRKSLLGQIVGEEMHLNSLGKIAREEWLRNEIVRLNVKLDIFTIMPNHVHGILQISDVGATRRVAPTENHRSGPVSGSIGAVIGQFKSITVKKFKALKLWSDTPFWQRNYYEHIIRSDDELEKVRQYILYNPQKWDADRENLAVPVNKRDQRDEMKIILGFVGAARRVASTALKESLDENEYGFTTENAPRKRGRQAGGRKG